MSCQPLQYKERQINFISAMAEIMLILSCRDVNKGQLENLPGGYSPTRVKMICATGQVSVVFDQFGLDWALHYLPGDRTVPQRYPYSSIRLEKIYAFWDSPSIRNFFQ